LDNADHTVVQTDESPTDYDSKHRQTGRLLNFAIQGNKFVVKICRKNFLSDCIKWTVLQQNLSSASQTFWQFNIIQVFCHFANSWPINRQLTSRN